MDGSCVAGKVIIAVAVLTMPLKVDEEMGTGAYGEPLSQAHAKAFADVQLSASRTAVDSYRAHNKPQQTHRRCDPEFRGADKARGD